MPASPGLMIGVPVSIPKTPMFVIVIVPPCWSAGVVLPSRAVSVSCSSARASSRSVEVLRVLDVRHEQAARRGRGDAEVHVVADVDLALVGSTHAALTIGVRRTAQIIALAMISSGETLTSAKSGEVFSRLTNSIVRVASTSIQTDTCGAVYALLHHAAARSPCARPSPGSSPRERRPARAAPARARAMPRSARPGWSPRGRRPTRASRCCGTRCACEACSHDVVARDLAGRPGGRRRRRGRRRGRGRACGSAASRRRRRMPRPAHRAARRGLRARATARGRRLP